MLDEQKEKSVLDNPRIQREEALLKQEPVKKGKFGLILKIIFILAIIGVVLYLFVNPEIIRDPINQLFGRLG